MKKKRIDNKSHKKNGSSSISAGANGSKAVNAVPNDKHHNRSTPCSNVTAAIALEIFPTLARPPDDAAGENDGSAANGGKNLPRIGNAAGKKPKEEGSTADESGSSTQKEEQPLLGFMIQRYLVEERKKARGDVGSSGGSSKKKKNKKKRKKKAAASPSAEGAGGVQEVANRGGDQGGEENDCQGPSAAKAQKEPLTSVDSGKENFFENAEGSIEAVAKKTLKISNCLPSFESSLNPPPSSHNCGKGGKEPTSLDRLLDSLIDSKKASDVDTESNKRGERQLEAFSAFLIRKLESHLQRSHQSQQRKDGKSNRAASSSVGSEDSETRGGAEFKDVLPTISINDAHDLAAAADCRTCRTSATCHLRTLIRETPFLFAAAESGMEIEYQPAVKNPIIVLDEESAKLRPGDGGSGARGFGYSLSIPRSGRFADSVESAFDYLSMDDVDLEAGGERKGEKEGATSPSSFHLELRPISQASDRIRFLQIGTAPEGGDGGGGVAREYPMNTQDIIDLVKCILLPCGLDPSSAGGDDALDVDGLSDKELNDIGNQGFTSLNGIQSELLKAKMSIFSMKEEIDQVEDCNNRSVFDAKTPKILNSCDASCQKLLEDLGRLINRLVKSVCYVAWSSERGAQLLQFLLVLWRNYTLTFVHLVQPTMQHRGKMLAMVDRKGVVPQAYSSKVARDSLEDLVRKKMTALNGLVQELEQLTKGTSHAPSSMLQLFVVGAYRQHVEPQKTTDDVFPSQEGEDLFMQLISARIELSQTTLGGSIEGVTNKAREHRAEMKSLLRKARKVIIAMEDFAPRTKVDFLVDANRNFESTWYDLEKDQKEIETKIAGGKVGYEVEEMKLFLKRTEILVSQWVVLLCARQCDESSISLSLPSVLQTWLDGISGTEMPKWMPGEKGFKEQCRGDGAERRVSGILAALIYRWLEARCSEWHAELTRDELLQSMDMEEPVAGVAREGGSKSAKKKKSKRKSKNNRDDKHDLQANEVVSGAADKSPAVDESGTDTTPGGNKQLDFEISQDEKKDDVFEAGAQDESALLDAESIKLAERLAAIEDVETEMVIVSEGEWKQKKSNRKSSGGTRQTEKSQVGENPVLSFSQVEKEEVTVDVDADDESQTEVNDGDKGSDAERCTFKYPEEESAMPVACESSSGQLDDLNRVDNPPQEELDNMNFEHHPSVGVIDGNHVVAAEMFLVKRLEVIAGLEEMDLSAKKVPVVRM